MSDSNSQQEHTPTSGWLTDEFEGVSSEFTHVERLPDHGHNTFTRARRYGRLYLLKGLTAETAEQAAYRETLRKEFDMMMRVQHPGVVQAVGFETVPDVGSCIVMEWVEGATLAKWLAGSTTQRERRRVFDLLLDAVEYVHSVGIAHRDLKPSNIMVTSNGSQPKLIDFGLADSDVHTTFKGPGGTARYMAPEQATGSIPDVRNDIYSLGVIMQQMRLGSLTGMVAHRCLRAIDDRPQSVADLRKALHRVYQVKRWALRMAGAAAIVAAVVVWQMSQPVAPDNSTPLVDSLHNQLNASIKAQRQSDTAQQQLRQRVAGMNDTLRQLREANLQFEQREEERMERQRAVDEAIDKGVALVREANRATHISEHLDTVSHYAYVWLDAEHLIKQGRAKAREYLLSLNGRFSTKEMAEIEYALNEYCNDYELRMDVKRHQLYGL
ncbi:MAG: serine/threonine protein kinase [Muribaculaceae bacterium]|nr:serine/threonine protein kinase [Muribaculaceae bacterium]